MGKKSEISPLRGIAEKLKEKNVRDFLVTTFIIIAGISLYDYYHGQLIGKQIRQKITDLIPQRFKRP